MFETLQTFAEIAIAMAGFSGVVVAFGNHIPDRARFRLQLLITLNSEIIVFAMLPSVMVILLSQQQTWRLCIAGYACVHGVHLLYSVFSYRDTKGAAPTFDKILMSLGGVFCIAMMTLALVNNTQLIQFIYLLFMLFVVMVAGTQFYRLLMEINRVES